MIALLAAMLLAVSPAPPSLVDTFVGTSGTIAGGPIDTFPGADMPFGMVQWSPDTPSQNAGGGYEFTDKSITGFSLTHLSGPGCSVFGDFAMMPSNTDVADPLKAAAPFSHANEIAAPGYYEVSFGSPAIRAQLSVTDRTGLGVFTFSGQSGTIVINPASNQAGVTAASIRALDDRTVIAQASSGYFCGMPDRYTVYEAVRFDRPFAANVISHVGNGTFPWISLRFDTSRMPVVRAQVALSFVDERGARANLAAEARSWNIIDVRNHALASWNALLSRIRVSGGSRDAQRQFYTALYHAMLHPNLIDDSDGRYRGYDGTIQRVRPGHHEYANYSDWDIYRTQIPLIALLAPRETSDMMQSLVDAYRTSGWLPRWALVNQPTSVMGGDSVDAVIAGAYAYGARDFDVRGALAAMVKGATDTSSPPGYGWYIERPESAPYQRLGYIPNTHTTSVSPVPNGASETLEYSLDDASIAAFARATGNDAVYRRFLPRASNWATLFDTATGWIAPRDGDGAFEDTPVGEAGQSGFQEGNAAQYTWMVPQDLPGLVRAMGGETATRAKLDRFFSQLNAGQDHPYAWMGNEPSIGSPWVYLAAGEPWQEQAITHTVMQTLYADRPDGIPGNDDLGTMSAWYVWSAIGLYPQFTAVRALDIGTPLFPHVDIDAPGGPHIVIDAADAGKDTPYVSALRVNGARSNRSWIALPASGTVRLDFSVATDPNRTWAASPSDAMPAFAPFRGAFPPSTTARISLPSGQIDLRPGETTTISVHQTATKGWASFLYRTTLDVHLPNRSGMTIGSAHSGLYNLVVNASADGAVLPPARLIVRVAQPGEVLPLAWIANRFDNTVMPYDPRSNALGTPVTVGEEPRDGVLTLDNRRFFIADRAAQSVSVVDTVEQRVIATVRVGNSPNGTALSPDGRTVYVANYDDGTIQAIDAQTLRAGAPLPVGTGPRFIAPSPDGSHLYVSLQGQNALAEVDARAMRVMRTIDAGAKPTGLAVSADGKTLYVADNAAQNVEAIDTASGAVIATVPAGVEAQMVAVSPDGRFAFVPNFASTTLTPVDLVAMKALPDVTVGGQPFDVEWLHDGSAALVILRRDNALVRVDRDGRVGDPLFLGSGGAYTIALPHRPRS